MLHLTEKHLLNNKITENHCNWYVLSSSLTLKVPRKTASESRLLNILADFSNLFLHTGKQCGPWSDWSSLIWGHTVCKNDFYNHKQMTKQTTIVVIGTLRVNNISTLERDKRDTRRKRKIKEEGRKVKVQKQEISAGLQLDIQCKVCQ